VYFCKNGFARFCNVKYSADLSDLDNPYVHLTNVAIQKKGSDYNDKHGNKFHIRNLRLQLEATRGHAAATQLFDEIENIILQSLKAVQNVMINDRHCFECYGFDILIDDKLKPWLLEVNASPSLSTTTDADRVLKTQLLDDIFSVVFPPDFPSAETSQGCTSWNPAPEVGQFVLIYDEAAEVQAEREKSEQTAAAQASAQRARRMGSWR
jgi:tubulin polyglutamylase TTLL1